MKWYRVDSIADLLGLHRWTVIGDPLPPPEPRGDEPWTCPQEHADWLAGHIGHNAPYDPFDPTKAGD